MSSREDSAGAEQSAFRALDAAVGRTLGELERLRSELAASRKRRAELADLLEGFGKGDRDPVEMAARLDVLEKENADLRERVARGREGVERLLARIRFLEDQR
ncbi:MAG: hypothetical protein KY453_08405 [Gemmatimonadetes bacterium]|nr:hypothetical protein [Gemmatimonadota bacterium]